MKKIIFHISPHFHHNRIAYVLDFLQNHPLSPPEVEIKINNAISFTATSLEDNIVIFYGHQISKKHNCYFIPAQDLFFGKKLINTSDLSANEYHWKTHQLFSVEKNKQLSQAFFKENTFGFDLLETIFFHLSRYEEYYGSPKDWDKYDMRESSRHFLVEHKLYQQPVLDHLVYCFYEALNINSSKKATVFQLTHDIDSIWKLPSLYRYMRATARLIKDRKEWRKIHQLYQQYRNVKTNQQEDPFDVFDWFLNENKSIKKVIYFMAGGTTRYENFYKIQDPYVKKIIEKAQRFGYEIGLHPSYLTWKNGDMFQQELQTLEQVVGEEIKHSRQHFLHCSFQTTFDIIEGTGIQNDSTLGYQDLIGFRCGTGFDFHPYNFQKEQVYTFIETPLIVMDCALLAMCNYNVSQAQILLDDFLQRNAFYTKITFNIHNHIFDEIALDAPAMKRLYVNLLRTTIL